MAQNLNNVCPDIMLELLFMQHVAYVLYHNYHVAVINLIHVIVFLFCLITDIISLLDVPIVCSKISGKELWKSLSI
jgi:hypothetical protein